MTKKELIEALKDVPDDTEILISECNYSVEAIVQEFDDAVTLYDEYHAWLEHFKVLHKHEEQI